jgi:hypothetical protein
MNRIILILLLLPGCAPYIDKSELNFREESLNINESGTINQALKGDFSNEWNIVGKSSVPELGVALSGGGTRAASFSIGVLQALHENGVLNDVDIISSVSGGSYAAYWYYSQHLYMDEVAKDYSTYQYDRDSIFNNFDLTRPNYCLSGKNIFCKDRNRMEYRFQRHLEDRSDIFVRSVAKHNQVIDYIEKAFLWVPSMATHLITDFVFDWDINSNPLRKFYENGLERTYGYVPLDKIKDPMEGKGILVGENYVNAKNITSFLKRVYAEPLTFKRLPDYL